MKTLLLFIILYPTLVYSQQEAISVSVSDGFGYSMQYNSFEKHFDETSYINVWLSQPDVYHQKNIQKVELFANNDNGLYYSAEFDRDGRIKEVKKKGNYFLISRQTRKDSIRHTDTFIVSYYQQTKLMRTDTIVSQQIQYSNKDTLLSYTRTNTHSWYNGALLNEQNEYYNGKYLNKKIDLNAGSGMPVVLYQTRKGPKVYLRHKLKTNYDTGTMYSSFHETTDAAFFASTEFGKNQSDILQMKNHPFVKTYGKKNNKKCFTEGSCFVEPRIYFNNYGCGTGLYNAQQERLHTSYGFTNNKDGLYETYFKLYKEDNTPAEQHTLLYFRYTKFE